MCSWLSHCLNETPLGLKLSRAPGPHSLASAGAFFICRSFQDGYTERAGNKEGRALVTCSGLGPLILPVPNSHSPAHLSYIISSKDFLSDFVFSSQSPSNKPSFQREREAKWVAKIKSAFTKHLKQEHLPAFMGRVRWLLGEQFRQIGLGEERIGNSPSDTSESISAPMEQKWEQLKPCDL